MLPIYDPIFHPALLLFPTLYLTRREKAIPVPMPHKFTPYKRRFALDVPPLL